MTTEDALAECDIQKAEVDIAAGSASVVFDLKGSLHYDEANVAVLTADGVDAVSWSGSRALYRQRFQAFYVGASSLSFLGGAKWRMRAEAINGQALTIEAERIGFWFGYVEGGDAAPPQYDEDSEEVIRRALYNWDTMATALSWTSTDLI